MLMLNAYSHLIDRSKEVLAHVSPERWNPLPRLTNTIVEPVTKTDGTRGPAILSQYLGALVLGEATPAHYEKFGKAIDKLLERRLIVGVLMEPAEMPLTRYEPKNPIEGAMRLLTPASHPDSFIDHGLRSMLLCYMHSHKTMAELNAVLGFEGFINEGVLPHAW